MKVKQYIYHWLFFPLLAILLASGTTGCSNESVMEEEDNNTGHTYLTITTRGINVTEDSDFENYVGELRVMAFDSQGNIVSDVNFTIDDWSDYKVQGSGDDTYITVETEILGGKMTSGTYSFYFVANETDYSTDNNETLSRVLANVATEEALKNIKVKTAFNVNERKPEASKMLMSVGPLKVLIREGENNEIGNANNRIELIRAFAKAQLLLKVKSGVTVPASTEVSLSVPAPNSFYLLPGTEEEITSTTTLPYTVAKSDDHSLMDTELKADDYFFISEVVYLPERYLSANTEEKAIKYQITLDGNDYRAPIADNTTGTLDYNIKRNYAYTTIGTYAPASETPVTLEWKVKEYTDVNVDVPTFK